MIFCRAKAEKDHGFIAEVYNQLSSIVKIMLTNKN